MKSWEKHQEEVFKDQEWSGSPDELARLEVAKIAVGKDKNVLDIGCGNAIITEEIRKMGNKVWAVDFPEVVFKFATKYPKLTFYPKYDDKIQCSNNKFDIVTSFEVVEHVIDLDKYFKEIKRVLKPGGKLILTTPNLARTLNIVNLILGGSQGIYYPLQKNMHINFFTPKTLIKIVEHYGFKVEDIGTIFTLKTDYRQVMDEKEFKHLNSLMNKHMQPELRGDMLYIIARKEANK